MFADVVENFRNTCLENYGFCPSHCLTAPGLGWDKMLSMTKVELDPISDVNMYLSFGEGIRGCVSYVSKRYSKAN